MLEFGQCGDIEVNCDIPSPVMLTHNPDKNELLSQLPNGTDLKQILFLLLDKAI